MEIDRGRSRPDNEAKDQRDARQQPPIDLVGFRRRKKEQEEDFLSPNDKEYLEELREWMSIPLPDSKELIERIVALIYETPLNSDDEQAPLANTEQKKAKVLYLHKPSSQDTEPPPSPNIE